MARYPEGHNEEVRAKIVDAAASAFRERGLEGIGIQALMKRLGLTHGGFYVHFPNRDALVAAAIERAMDQVEAALFAASARGEPLGPTGLVKRYLTEAHRDHPEQGCPVAAVGAEAPRQSDEVRGALERVAERFLANVDRVVGGEAKKGLPSDRALAVGCVLVGSLVLSRALGSTAASQRALAVGRSVALSIASGEPSGLQPGLQVKTGGGLGPKRFAPGAAQAISGGP